MHLVAVRVLCTGWSSHEWFVCVYERKSRPFPDFDMCVFGLATMLIAGFVPPPPKKKTQMSDTDTL